MIKRPPTRLVIVVLVFPGTTTSAEVAICDVHRSIHVRLILIHPARIVRTVGHRVVGGGLPHRRHDLFQDVAKTHCLDGNTLLGGLVACLRVEFSESSPVEIVIHTYHSVDTHPFSSGKKRVRLTTLMSLPVAG